MTPDLDKPANQAQFADLVGSSQPSVSRMVRDGILARGGTLRQWIRAYVAALEAEKDALTGAGDDSAEARAARLALTTATTKLRTQQTRMLVREYVADADRYVKHVLGEVQAVLYRGIPNATVARLLTIIPRQEDRYAAADAFREVVGEAVAQVMEAEFDEEGFIVDDTAGAES